MAIKLFSFTHPPSLGVRQSGAGGRRPGRQPSSGDGLAQPDDDEIMLIAALFQDESLFLCGFD